ncbi:hypothetical protein [Sutcliffiella horikoshii]|uniref:hypothetical protein n=1 Tax=Sutcliffiella horikoshii TaxID=79883 RepID=UPI00384FB1BA
MKEKDTSIQNIAAGYQEMDQQRREGSNKEKSVLRMKELDQKLAANPLYLISLGYNERQANTQRR